MTNKLTKVEFELKNTESVPYFHSDIPKDVVLKGVLNCFHTIKQFPLPDIHNIDGLMNKTFDWTLKHKLLEEPKTPEEVKKIRDYIEALVTLPLFMHPLSDPNAPHVYITIQFMICVAVFDDLFIEPLESSNVYIKGANVKEEWGRGIKIVGEIYIQALREGFTIDRVSGNPLFEKYPILRNLYEALSDMTRLAIETVPNYLSKSTGWVDELKNSIGGAIWSCNLTDISEESFKFIRKFDSAALPSFEIALAGENIILEKKHRENIVFKRWLDSLGGAVAFTNDILGLIKELRDGDDMNLVIFKWKRNNGDIQKCLSDTVDLVNFDVREVVYLSQKLEEEFPNDETIRRLIKQGKLYIDGHIYWYAEYNKRYGLVNIENK